MNDAMFIVLINSSVIVILKLISMCYKSKCKKFDCLGIHIERDIDNEEKLDEQEIVAKSISRVASSDKL
jgi:hypothetical protein